MLIHKKAWFVTGLLALILPLSLAAQTAGKVAIFSMGSAMEKSMEGKQAIAEFQAKLVAKQNELQKKNADLEELKKQLQNQGPNMNDDARATLTKKIDTGTTELQRSQEDAQKEFSALQNDIYQRLGGKMMSIVEKYAKEHEIALVVDPSMQNSQVLYFDPSIDITDDIVKQFDSSGASTAAPAAAKPAPAKPATTPAAKPAAPPAAKP